MSDKPREFWFSENDELTDCGHWPDDWCYVKKLEYDALKAENEKLKRDFTELNAEAVRDREEYKEFWVRAKTAEYERDTALAEVERLKSRHLWNSTYADTQEGLKELDCSPEVLGSIKTRKELQQELTREREITAMLVEALLSLSESHDPKHKTVVEFAATALQKYEAMKDTDPFG